MEFKINEKALEGKLEELEKSKSWSPRLVSKLENLIRSGDDFSLFRINPVQFAAEKGAAEPETIDLFLHACKAGIFQMNWHLLCAGCGMVLESFASLTTLDAHFHCQMCRVDLEVSLDDFIEVSFTVSPSVREIAYHNPERLSIEDYYLRYQVSRNAMLTGGPSLSEAVLHALHVLSFVVPGEEKTFAMDLSKGYIAGCDRMNRAELYFPVEGDIKATPQRIVCHLTSEGKYDFSAQGVCPGKVEFVFKNSSNKRAAVYMIFAPADPPMPAMAFRPFLSGKRIFTSQTFRDLFRLETVKSTQGLSVKDITVLFTDLKGSTALYDAIGDLKAFALVQQHFERLAKVIQGHSGAVVKTIGDAIMACFMNPVDAFKASTQMLEEIEGFNQEQGHMLNLKIGLHRGASIAVTLNDRLDYFGQTVNIASRVQGLADSDEIYITEDIYKIPELQSLLQDLKVEARKAKLKGIQEEMQVYKITHEAAHAEARV